MVRERPKATSVCYECGQEFLRDRYRIVAGENKYCSRGCYDLARANWRPENFWRNVSRDISGCWLWLSNRKSVGGYGILRVRGTQTMAHRYAYELTHGPIPEGLFVCHKCDVPACVNPDHLFLGTALDNTIDMIGKGRSRFIGHSPRLSDDQVREVRRRYLRGAGPKPSNIPDLAIEYGMSADYIRKVATGRQRRDVLAS
jgi:hypothetical protein